MIDFKAAFLAACDRVSDPDDEFFPGFLLPPGVQDPSRVMGIILDAHPDLRKLSETSPRQFAANACNRGTFGVSLASYNILAHMAVPVRMR